MIVTSGPCIVDAAEGICVTSPRYPDEFQATPTGCTLAAGPNTYISVEGGNTRSSAVPNNTFVVDGTRVEDGTSLDGTQTQTGMVEWMPTVNTWAKGWRLCFNREPVMTSGVHVSGDCKLHRSTCVSSKGYPNRKYGRDEDCAIRVRRGSIIHVEEFDVNANSKTFDTYNSRDALVVDYSKEYFGDSAHGLDGSITTTGRITWSTSGRYTASGWLICFSPPVTVASGPCVVEADARCVTSPQYPDDFRATTAGCTLTAWPNAYISVADGQSSALHDNKFTVDGTPVDNGRRLDGRRTKSGLVEWLPTSTSTSSTKGWRICFNYRRKPWSGWTIVLLTAGCMFLVGFPGYKRCLRSDKKSHQRGILQPQDADRTLWYEQEINAKNDAEWMMAGGRNSWDCSNCCFRWRGSCSIILLCFAMGWVGFSFWLKSEFPRPYKPSDYGAYE